MNEFKDIELMCKIVEENILKQLICQWRRKLKVTFSKKKFHALAHGITGNSFEKGQKVWMHHLVKRTVDKK